MIFEQKLYSTGNSQLDYLMERAFSEGMKKARQDRDDDDEEMEYDKRMRKAKRGLATIGGATAGLGTGAFLDYIHPENAGMHDAGKWLTNEKVQDNLKGQTLRHILFEKADGNPTLAGWRSSVVNLAKTAGQNKRLEELLDMDAGESAKIIGDKLKRGGIARRASLIALPTVVGAGLVNSIAGRRKDD